MRILITVNAAWNVWNFRRGLAEALMDIGHSVTVLAPADDSVQKLEAMGIRFKHLEMNVKGLNPVEDLRLIRRLKRALRDENPDVVISYTIKNNIFGAIAAGRLRIPIIPTVTGLGTAFLSGGVLKILVQLLYRIAFKRSPTVFFQNSDDRDLFIEGNLVRFKQARLIAGSGIDLKYFSESKVNDGPITFILVARLLRDKGVVEFVEAARLMKAKYPNVCFQLLGPVGSENRTAIDQATLRSWVDDGLVEYLGTAVDVRPYIAASSCVVLPSYREGAPRTLIEAAAMGRPTIATDVPGCRSVVDHEITGYLCVAKSAPSLADAMTRFVCLPIEARIAMGRAGRYKMEREYDQAIVVKAYLDAIAEVRS